jgi:hypothetical protein
MGSVLQFFSIRTHHQPQQLLYWSCSCNAQPCHVCSSSQQQLQRRGEFLMLHLFTFFTASHVSFKLKKYALHNSDPALDFLALQVSSLSCKQQLAAVTLKRRWVLDQFLILTFFSKWWFFNEKLMHPPHHWPQLSLHIEFGTLSHFLIIPTTVDRVLQCGGERFLISMTDFQLLTIFKLHNLKILWPI